MPPTRLVLDTVRKSLREKGLTITVHDGEYRVTFARGAWAEWTPASAEAAAYYTNSIYDALITGVEMARTTRWRRLDDALARGDKGRY